MQRLRGLDLLRGTGIVAVVFLHSATFHYEGITQIDWDNPPLLITVIGFLLMWAGLFAIISSTAYAYTFAGRMARGDVNPRQLLKHLWVSAGFYLVVHYVYFCGLAPKLLDVVHGEHQYALIPGLIANGTLPLLSADRLFYSTTLSMIAWNLFLTAPLLYVLSQRGGLERMRRNNLVLGGLGTAVMIASLARIPLYPLAFEAIERGNVLAALCLGFLVNKNNPILPYLGFGLFGTWLGLALARCRSPRRVLRWFAIAGALWLVAGLVGLFLLPDTMLEREIDLYWYFLVLFQLGLFLLIVVGVLALADFSRLGSGGRILAAVRRMGTCSLSVFMLETVLSQLLVLVGDALWPGWRLKLELCLTFGALNAALWVGIAAIWTRFGLRYSMEWLTAQVYARFRRPSDKMAAIRRLGQRPGAGLQD